MNMPASSSAKRFVLCIRNDDYPAALEIRKVYRMISDAAAEREGLIRVVDESGEDYLYPREYFARIALSRNARAAIADVA